MKTKRLVALVLALTLVFCFMAMSLSASAEEIQPRSRCSECGGAKFYSQSTVIDSYTEYVGGCSSINVAHNHLHEKIQIINRCPDCGYYHSYAYWRHSCV